MKQLFRKRTPQEAEIYEKLMQENEAAANRSISILLLVIAGVYIFCGIMNTLGVAAEPTPVLFLSFFISGLVIALLVAFAHKRKALAWKWLKYISLFLVTVSILVLNIATGYKLWLLYAAPILLSIRYYNRKFTSLVALYAETMTVLSVFTNAYLAPYTELLDLNLVSFREPGTLEYWSWLHNAVVAHGFEPELLVKNGFRLSVLPNVASLALITVIAEMLISNAVRILMEENEGHEREIQLLKASTVDSTTGLFNRRAYNEDRAALTPETMKNLVFAMFDINGLKAANDTIGHSAGDELIQGAARCIEETFAPYGKVYRWGGDEFAALLYTNPGDLETLKAEYEVRCVKWAGNAVKTLSVSAGYVAVWEMDGDAAIGDMEALADQRMYEIKQAHYRKLRQEE